MNLVVEFYFPQLMTEYALLRLKSESEKLR